MAFIALIPILITLEKQTSIKSTFWWGWGWGSLVCAGFHAWALELTPFGPWPGILAVWIGMSIGYGLFFGAGMSAIVLLKNKGTSLAMAITVIWPTMEWIKSLGPVGNTALTLGYSQANSLYLLQHASWIGPFGVSAILVASNIFIWESISNKKYRVPAILFFLSIFGSGWALFHQNIQPTDTFKIGMLQPNHKQEQKLDFDTHRYLRQDILKKSREGFDDIALLLWPETITPGLNLNNQGFQAQVENLAADLGCDVLWGTPKESPNGFFNAVVLSTPESFESGEYLKTRLMPFGEYWPLKPLFRGIGLGNIIPGSEYKPGHNLMPINWHDHKLGIGICLETTYPQHFRELVQNGSDILITHVNNAWFGASFAADQLLQMSRFRSVENRRMLLQVANTGLSGVINPKGELNYKSQLNQVEIIQTQATTHTETTPYTRYGNWILVILWLVILVAFQSRNQ